MTEEKQHENPLAKEPGKGAQPGEHKDNGRKPIRFQFGPDTTDEDIDNFLDMILGPEEDKQGEKRERQE